MPYISQYEYYENNGNAPENQNWGSYQYVSLQDIVTNYFLEASESLIYFQLKLLKSFKVFLKQNINTFYLKDLRNSL